MGTARMHKVALEEAGKLAHVHHGVVDPARLTLFSTMKNEMGFLPAWLAHHRANRVRAVSDLRRCVG